MSVKQPKVTMYSTSWCAFCRRTREFFGKHGIKFKDIDVEKDLKAVQEMIKKSKQRGIPVIEIGGEIVVGYDEEKLRKLLKIKK